MDIDIYMEQFFAEIDLFIYILYITCMIMQCVIMWERSGSVVECLTRDRGAMGLNLTGVSVLWFLSKTHLS